MRLIVLSRGRHDYSPTLETMPKIMRPHVQVWVPKEEYGAYKRSPIFKGVEIVAWPSHIDCIPKKRRYLYENVDGAYMAIDDDLKLMVWDTEKGNYSNADSNPKKFIRGLEIAYGKLDTHTNVGIANTFMTSMKVKDKQTLEFGEVPFCFAGFSKDRPKLKFQTFFFTDIAMPMQIIKRRGHESVITMAHIAYGMRSNKKLAATGTTPYRTDEVILHSALSLSQQMPGYVTGLRNTGNNGGGWSLKKTFRKPNIDRTNEWYQTLGKEYGLTALPTLVELDLKTPMADLHLLYKKGLAKAAKGIGNKIGTT